MKKRSAFTLLEIIIVITIVAIMAVLAVSSYGTSRLRAQLDFTVDLLMSTVKQRQSLAKSGKDLICYGIVFDSQSSGGEAVQLIQAPYVAVLGNMADFCDFTQSTLTVFDQMENFKIVEIQESKSVDVTAGIGQEVEKLALVFKPPLAKVLLGTDVNNLTTPDKSAPVDSPVVMITVAIPNGLESRTFIFDSTSGAVKRLETGTVEPQIPNP